LKPLAGRKASTITQADVQRLHASIGSKGHYAANRALALVSVVFSRCAANLPNPAKGIRRFKEQSRDRFLHADELRAFFKALEAEPSGDWRDFFVVSLLTGARRANVLAMRWADVNLDRGLWRIPETESKNHEPLICVLVVPVVEILRRRFAENGGASPFAFPGVGKTGHLAEPKKPWHEILDRAGLLDAAGKNTVRIHDLRRTLGSWQAAGGASLSIIGRALGHKNVATTAVYARLDVDPVRQSLEAATQAMLTAAAGKTSTRALPPAKRT
jgi:integrase